MTQPKRAGATGPKGTAVIDACRAHPEWTRRDIAAHVRCSIARVGEALRDAKMEAATPDRRKRAGKDTAKVATTRQRTQNAAPIETRTGRCEHERARKTRRGTCKACPPLVVPNP